MRDQRGSADPQAIGTVSGVSGFLTFLVGSFGASEWAAVIGAVVSILTLAIFWWRSVRVVEIQERQAQEQREHFEEIERIQRGEE